MHLIDRMLMIDAILGSDWPLQYNTKTSLLAMDGRNA